MALSKADIITAALGVIARHGASKATVCDVAEALGVSHGSIYRFFPTKQSLREAVVGEWLAEITAALADLALTGSPPERLRAWFDGFSRIKRLQRQRSPELFEAFRALGAEEPEVVAAYKHTLAGQIARIVDQGIATGDFRPCEPLPTAMALIAATALWHHPHFVRHWEHGPGPDFDALWTILIGGLTFPQEHQ